MGWFLAAAVFLLTTAIVMRTSSPRNALLIAGGALLSIIAALVLFVSDGQQAGTEAAAIAPDKIVLSDIKLTSDRYGHQLSGRVTNRADRRLGTLSLKVTFRDCKAPTDCKDVGAETAQVFIALPAGQTGSFSVLLARAGDLARPELVWTVEVAKAAADF